MARRAPGAGVEKKGGKKAGKAVGVHKAVFDSVTDGIVVLDKTGRITKINRAITQTGGYTEKDVVGTRLAALKMFTPESLAKMLAAFARRVLGQATPPYAVELRTKKGKTIFVEIHGSPLREGGRITGSVAILRDITKRKKAEEALRESEEKFKDVTVASADWVWEVDRTGKYTYASGKVKQILGYTPKELLRLHFYDLMPKDEAKKAMAEFNAALKTGAPIVDLENLNLTKDGGEIFFLTNGVPIYDDKRKVVGYRGVDKDITERKKAEEALKKSEERYRGLVEGTEAGFYTAALNGDALYASKFVERIVEGFKAAEWRKKGFWAARIHQNDRKAVLREWSRGVKSKKPFVLQYRFVCRDGTPVWVEDHAFPSPSKDMIEGFILDITERKKAEEHLAHIDLVLRAVRNVNQLIVREKSSEKLLKSVCETLTREQGYNSAWACLFDGGSKPVMAAESGIGTKFSAMEKLMKKGKLTRCGEKALGQNRVVVTEDPAKSCRGCPLHCFYAGKNALTVRLAHGGRTYGLLSVSVPAAIGVDREEQSLFMEVAGDISLALHSIELGSKRVKAAEMLRESEEKYKVFWENTGTAMCTVEADKTISFANETFSKLCGYTLKEIEWKKKWTEFVTKEYLKRMEEYHTERRKKDGEAPSEYEFDFVGKKGAVRKVFLSVQLIPGTKKSICSLIDITERKKAEEMLRKEDKRLEGLTADLSFLYEVTSIAFAAETEQELLGKALEESCRALGAELGIVWMHDKEHGELVARKCFGLTEQECAGMSMKPGEGCAGKSFQRRAPLISTKRRLRGYKPTTSICVPLTTKGGTIGVVEVLSLSTELGMGEQRLLKIVADQVSTAINALRARGELQKSVKELKKINKFLVGREMRIIELKNEVKELRDKLK
ncbi:MAG: PAS domain S-box protein [Candidatus Diapherotrites archaeon]|nr:PAS domain S-box protein [Candidatus Diapherotrites archaeon]